MHSANSFITLTYSDEHLPADHSVNVKHWQTFAKRLRKNIGPFRFYHCGEYGNPTEGRRPHYHALIFGHDFAKDRKFYKHTDRGDKLFTSELLDGDWRKGNCYIGALTIESAAYVARYCMKKQGGEKAKAHYKHYNIMTGKISDLKPEYATMSRRPGIGKPWLDKYKSDVYPHDLVVNQDGSTARPPKYYDAQLPESELEIIKAGRVKQAKQHSANNTPARLLVRQTVKLAQIGQLQRHTPSQSPRKSVPS